MNTVLLSAALFKGETGGPRRLSCRKGPVSKRRVLREGLSAHSLEFRTRRGGGRKKSKTIVLSPEGKGKISLRKISLDKLGAEGSSFSFFGKKPDSSLLLRS